MTGKWRYILLLSLLLLLSCGNEGRREMQRLLAEADSMNRNYVTFTTDTALLRAVRLADRHGTNTDRVRARYLLGCAYRDMGEAPQALDSYHQALEVADTNSADCDYRLLAKIHGQAGDLFAQQGLSRNAKDEYRHGEQFAWKANDTLTAILAYGQQAGCYYDMNMYDSVLFVAEQTRRLLMVHGDTLMANTFLAPTINILLSQGKYHEAKPLLYDYEYNSSVNCDSNIIPNYNLLYYYKAEYFRGVGNRDSSAVYFRRLLNSNGYDKHQRLASSGLFSLYSSTDNTDSIIKYGMLFEEIADSMYHYSEFAHLQYIQGLYNYHRHQQLSEQRKQALRNREKWLLYLLVAFVAIFASGYIIYRNNKEKRRRTEMQLDALSGKYEEMQMAIRERAQMNAINDNRLNGMIMQKDKQIVTLERHILSMGSECGLSEDVVVRHRLRSSQVYSELARMGQSNITMDSNTHRSLHDLFEAVIPSFSRRLFELYPLLQPYEQDLCMLARMGFSPQIIANLLGVTIKKVSTDRGRLAVKLFKESHVNAKQFDIKIQQVK